MPIPPPEPALPDRPDRPDSPNRPDRPDRPIDPAHAPGQRPALLVPLRPFSAWGCTRQAAIWAWAILAQPVGATRDSATRPRARVRGSTRPESPACQPCPALACRQASLPIFNAGHSLAAGRPAWPAWRCPAAWRAPACPRWWRKSNRR